MVYYDQPYVTIEIEPDKDLLVITWLGFAGSQEYRETRTRAIELSQEHGVKRWLSNMKNMKAIRQAEQEWTIDEWLPMFLKLKLERWAILVSDDMFNQMAVSSMMSKIRPYLNYPVEYFHDLNSARKWVQLPV